MSKGEEWALEGPVGFLEDLKGLEIETEREIETIDTIIGQYLQRFYIKAAELVQSCV